MHDIEPYYKWRDQYIAAEDERSPFYGTVNSEFHFVHKIYNHLIHPQWDDIGCETMYGKLIYADYEDEIAIIELIGEWNDLITNDILGFLKGTIYPLISEGITKFMIICENILNFHGDDNSYYEEWYEEIQDNDGWICFVNISDHVYKEMRKASLQYFVNMGGRLNELNWRTQKPENIGLLLESIIFNKRIE